MPPLITIRKPANMHCHGRGLSATDRRLEAVIELICQTSQAALFMLNDPPGRNLEEILRIYDLTSYLVEQIGYADRFQILMTLVLTDETTARDVVECAEAGSKYPGLRIIAAKLLPKGTTTGTDVVGVDITRGATPLATVLRELGHCRMPLPCHFEWPGVSPMYAEQLCISFARELFEQSWRPPIIAEHLTDASMLELVLEYAENGVFGTITPQALRQTWEDVWNADGSIRDAHSICKPPTKTAADREALIGAALTSNGQIFGVPDSAPHTNDKKAGPNPASGCFNLHAWLPTLAELAEQHLRLGDDWLENFTSTWPAAAYGVTLDHTEKFSLVQEDYVVPMSIPVPGTTQTISNWLGGQTLRWRPVL